MLLVDQNGRLLGEAARSAVATLREIVPAEGAIEGEIFVDEVELHTPVCLAEPSIPDYAGRTTATVQAWPGMNGKQSGAPANLADALIQLATANCP